MSQKALLLLAVALVVGIGAAIVWYPRPTQEVVPDGLDTAAPDVQEFIEEASEGLPDDSEASDEARQAPASSPTTSPAAVTTNKNATVSIDDTGFTPSTITVAAGTTVTFVNNGQAAHWPASDNHPTHEVLPEFDAKRGLLTGETYSHTFTTVGTWTIHDHLVPRLTGKVIVQ